MQVRLIVKTERGRRVLTINRRVAVIGRRKGKCAVRVPEPEVSRRHCRLVQTDGFVVIEDLGSINGTYLNGERVTRPCAVRPGDAVEVGPLRFIVGYELTPAARAKLEAFGADVELVPEDVGPDFLEDVEGLEWVEEEAPADVFGPAEEPEEAILDVESPTPAKGGPRVFPDDIAWVYPADLQLSDLLEPIDEEEERRRR